MPTTRQEDPAFLDRAPVRVRATVDFAHSPEAVFAGLADTPGWPDWFPSMRAAEWTSPAPHGVGSTRWVTVGPLTVHERFIVWEPGRRWGFTFTSTSLPFARAGVEVVDLEPLGADGTRVTYTMAIEPTVPAPIARLVVGPVAAALRRGLQGLARRLDETVDAG